MPAFIELAKSKNFPLLATTICATGGGAHKFSNEYETVSEPYLLYGFYVFMLSELYLHYLVKDYFLLYLCTYLLSWFNNNSFLI